MVFSFGNKSEAVRRALNAGDAARCAVLHKLSFAAPWSAAEFERLLASQSVLADGISVGDAALAGFILSRRAADEAEILTVAVDPVRRGRNLASQLLAFHAARLTRAGVARLFLEVEDGNAPARALYRRFGFREVGRRNNYYAGKDGARAHALILRADL